MQDKQKKVPELLSAMADLLIRKGAETDFFRDNTHLFNFANC